MILSALWQLPKADIVHLNSIFYPPSLIIAFFAIVFKKVIFWDPGGELAVECLKYGKLKKHLYLKLVRLIVTDKPYYHTTSMRESNDVRNRICEKAKIFEVPNYIDTIERINVDYKNQLLFIGRLHPVKAVENLINAIMLSFEFMNSDFILVIAGNTDNDYGENLLTLVKNLNLQEKVVFVGHVTDHQKFVLYAESYFMVLPSHSENFANVVTESLSQGTPVIASTGTPWKCLQDFNAGYHCSNSPEKLSEIIDIILTLDTATYLNMRKNAHDLLLQRFAMTSGVHEWVNAYSTALNLNK